MHKDITIYNYILLLIMFIVMFIYRLPLLLIIFIFMLIYLKMKHQPNKKEKTMKNSNKHLTPLRAIRAKCLDCSNNQPKEVRFCQTTKCPLFVYRFGKNPKRKGICGGSSCFSQKNAA